MSHIIYQETLKARAPAHSFNRCAPQYIIPTPTKWPETARQGGGEVMKNVSFLRLFDLCLINDEREKETGRKATFFHFFLHRGMQEYCRHPARWRHWGGGGEHGEQDRSRGGLEAKHGTYFHIAFPHLQLCGSQRAGSVWGNRDRLTEVDWEICGIITINISYSFCDNCEHLCLISPPVALSALCPHSRGQWQWTVGGWLVEANGNQ